MTDARAFFVRDRRPLYQQISGSIRSRITAGEFQPGERLPSEFELAKQYQVSRATVREALRSLEREGIVVSRRGHGTFVVGLRGALQVGVDSLYSVSDAIRRRGHTPDSRDVRVVIHPAPADVRSALRLGDSADVASIERTRLADGDAVVYSVDIVPVVHLASSEWRSEVEHGSLFKLLLRLGVNLSHTATRFLAVRASRGVAGRLGLSVGAPVLLLEETVYDSADRPVVLSRDYYRTDRIEVQLMRRRKA